MPHTWDPSSTPPDEALRRLVAGNERFRNAHSNGLLSRPWSADLAREPQQPFAIVLGCSDSRTPVEILFDQGFGDLFVVRVAGNVVAPSVVGSIEFAAAQFGTRLVVVMGHTGCGAISATVEAIEHGVGAASKNLQAIIERVSPHVEPLLVPDAPAVSRAELLDRASRANVRASADHLRHGSRLLEELVAAGRVAVVGAEYELETGKVHFFDGVPISSEKDESEQR